MHEYENDYELLYLVSENNEDANEIFYKKYKPLIEIKASKVFPIIKNKGYELNDLIQEGMIGLSQALNDYKEQKDVTFYTFANVCIDRQILSFVRNVNRQKHKVLNESISMDSSYDNNGNPLMNSIYDDKNSNPEDDLVSLETSSELKEKIYQELNEKQKEVFDLRMQGFNLMEIASLLNISRKSVEGILSRIRIKIKNIIDSE
jgi:RNA polymerase sporulation-specific sigma factor